MSAATITFTAISMKRFFMTLYSSLFTLHSSLFTRAALVLVEAFATVATFTADTRADHEGRSLSGHSEATGVDTVVLSQFKRRTIDGCRRHLTLCGRDADLHLIVLVPLPSWVTVAVPLPLVAMVSA